MGPAASIWKRTACQNVLLEFGPGGEVEHAEFLSTVIRSHARLTYTEGAPDPWWTGTRSPWPVTRRWWIR